MLEPMAQGEIPEQDEMSVQNMPVIQDEFPQSNPEPEMGAAAEAAVDDTPFPPPSVKILPQPPAKPRPIMADRSCFRHRSLHGWWKCSDKQ